MAPPPLSEVPKTTSKQDTLGPSEAGTSSTTRALSGERSQRVYLKDAGMFGPTLYNSITVRAASQIAAIRHHHAELRLAGFRADHLHLAEDVEALDHLAEDDVLAVQPRRRVDGDEELGAVGVRPCIGHRELTDGRVVDPEALVFEDTAVDGLSACAVAVGDVATLAHELRDDPVELGALQVQLLTCRAECGRERHECKCGLEVRVVEVRVVEAA
eukprot:scaffold51416_cov65-Phaeocystis_antarctica.AAC.1